MVTRKTSSKRTICLKIFNWLLYKIFFLSRTFNAKWVTYKPLDICMGLGYHFKMETPWSHIPLWFMVVTGISIWGLSGVPLMIPMALYHVEHIPIFQGFVIIGWVFIEVKLLIASNCKRVKEIPLYRPYPLVIPVDATYASDSCWQTIHFIR